MPFPWFVLRFLRRLLYNRRPDSFTSTRHLWLRFFSDLFSAHPSSIDKLPTILTVNRDPGILFVVALTRQSFYFNFTSCSPSSQLLTQSC